MLAEAGAAPAGVGGGVSGGTSGETLGGTGREEFTFALQFPPFPSAFRADLQPAFKNENAKTNKIREVVCFLFNFIHHPS
jgi:hypothetical protein